MSDSMRPPAPSSLDSFDSFDCGWKFGLPKLVRGWWCGGCPRLRELARIAHGQRVTGAGVHDYRQKAARRVGIFLARGCPRSRSHVRDPTFAIHVRVHVCDRREIAANGAAEHPSIRPNAPKRFAMTPQSRPNLAKPTLVPPPATAQTARKRRLNFLYSTSGHVGIRDDRCFRVFTATLNWQKSVTIH